MTDPGAYAGVFLFIDGFSAEPVLSLFQHTMSEKQANNPLHGIKLEMIVNELVEHFGWQELGERIQIRCFQRNPSVKSSLKFLRRTPWARRQVEELYLAMKRYG